MRHSRTLLFLIAIVALLALLVVYEPGREGEAGTVPLTPLATGEVQRLRIAREGQAAVEIERRDGHWWMTAPWPLAVPALDYRIESALGLLASPREHSQPARGLDLSQFELDSPSLVLEAGDERLAFGNAHPISRERHVLRGEEVHRIADFHFAAIDVDPADWVATAVIPPDAHLGRIELPGRVLVLAPPAPGPDGRTDPAAAALAWSGPQGEGELPAGEVANAWREARAWRVEPIALWEDVTAKDPGAGGAAGVAAAEAGGDAGVGAGVGPGPGAGTDAAGAAEARAGATPGGEAGTGLASPAGESGAAGTRPSATSPALGALDVATNTPLTGTLPGERIRLGWDQGGADFRIVKREPELVLARDDVGLVWVFEGPDARRLLGLADDPAGGDADASTGPGAAGAEDALPGLPGEHLHAH